MDITSTPRGGHPTINDEVRQRFMMAQSIYQGCRYLSTPATGRSAIVSALESVFGGTSFAHFNGMSPQQQELYVWVCRRELVKRRAAEAAVSVPDSNIATDWSHYVSGVTATGKSNRDLQVMQYLIEMQNQIAFHAKTYAAVVAWLRTLRLPATTGEILRSDEVTAQLAVAAIRMFHDDNWNGVNDPSSPGLRLTATNIAANKRNRAFAITCEVRSWIAEIEDLESNTFYNTQLQRLQGDVTGGNEITWQTLSLLYKRNIAYRDTSTNVWEAFVLGHGYIPLSGIDTVDVNLPIGTLNNYITFEFDNSDTSNPIMSVVAHIGEASQGIDTIRLTIPHFGSVFDPSAMTIDAGSFDTGLTLTDTGTGLRIDGSVAVALGAGDYTLMTVQLDATQSNGTYDITPTLDIMTRGGVTQAAFYSVASLRLRTGLVDEA